MTAFPLTSGLLIGSRRSLRLIERNLLVYKHGWLIILSGFFEPLFYLLSIGFAFGAVAMAATSFMRTWQDFDLIQLVILPLFLFSATFYPIETYPEALRVIVQLTPLYQGVDLLRSLIVGHLDWSLLFHVAYLVIMGIIGLLIVARRLDKLLLK